MASLDYRLNPIYTIKECSSCGALYTKSCGCSKGGFVDKFVRDPNKTPDSSQRPPPNCPNCGDPVDGLYCRQCALLRKKLEEVWSTICDENEIFQDFLNTSESSNDNTNVVNAPQEPFHPVTHQPPHEKTIEELLAEERAANIDQSPPQEMSIQDMEDLKQHYLDEMKSLINDLQIKDYRNERMDNSSNSS
ncbi:hypothetical protein Tco_1079976 [Tanacetum coccineum]|uniref:Uncharacterized protein n=1 Tax=Tanacetum coccineum TaxID=301880 RepID=A0ABQ5HTE3_9ASTR